MGVSVPDFEQHMIRRTGGEQRPHHLLYLDTETKDRHEEGITKKRMKMAWTCFVRVRETRPEKKEVWKYWKDPGLMQAYIEKQAHAKQVLYIIAHNVFFDLQGSDFFYHFTKAGWMLDFIYDKGLVYILSIRKGNRRIRCVSTTNYYPVSLRKLGEAMGLPKLDVDFEESTEEELKVYCKRDVEIVKAAFESYWRFLDKHQLGNLMATKSSQAFVAFRHRFMNKRIFVHRNEEISQLEQEAYFGGRVEAGYIGKVKDGPFVSLDVNSMYPYVMRLHSYPVKLLDILEKPDFEQIRYCLNKYCVVADCYIDTDEPAYAYRKGSKIIFPVGSFPVFLCTPGLEYAFSHNHLIRVNKIIVYEKDHIFDEYVDYFHALKSEYEKQGNAVMRMLCKYFLNSLYGKFAQRIALIEEEEDITNDGYFREEIVDLVTGKTEIITKLFNKTQIVWGDKVGKNSMIAIAAHVTEHARFYLYSLMKQAGLPNVLYMDTDSLKLRKKHMSPLSEYIDDNRLGALKLEEEFNSFVIYGPKDYETENFVKRKGVPKSAEKIKDGVYSYTGFLKQDSHLRKQVTRYFITRPVVKTLKREYNKGVVLKSGIVKPFKISVSP